MASKSKRTSMRGRLDRLQAEAAATETEKKEKQAAKKAAKKTTKKTTRKSTKAGADAARMRYVWQVQVKGVPVAQFSYSQRSEAASEAARLSKSTRKEHEVVKARVAMDE